MSKYKKKPIVIEAKLLHYNIDCINELLKWIGNNSRRGLDGNIIITTLEGDMVANTGDYIIKGIQGEFYPCKPDIFLKSYDAV